MLYTLSVGLLDSGYPLKLKPSLQAISSPKPFQGLLWDGALTHSFQIGHQEKKLVTVDHLISATG